VTVSRVSNGDQVSRVAALAMKRGKSFIPHMADPMS
jgi:hypothetical protein